MGSLRLPLVLMRHFRTSMSRLIYNFQLTNDDIRDKIYLLLQLLEPSSAEVDAVATTAATATATAKPNNASFLAIVQPLVSSMAIQTGFTIALDAAVTGTFQASLHRQITDLVCAMFSILLAHADRNSNLRLVDAARSSEQVRRIWLALFVRSANEDGHIVHASHKHGQVPQVAVVEDGSSGQRFVAQFPFSFFVHNMIQKLVDQCEQFPVDGRAAVLQKQVEMFNLPESLCEELPEELLKSYTHDMVSITVPFSPRVSRAFQSELIWAAICKVGYVTSGAGFHQCAPRRLSSIHSRYWLIEARLRAYLLLLDAVPSAQAAVLECVRLAPAVSFELDHRIVCAILTAHAALIGAWTSVEQYGAWLHVYRRLLSPLSALMQTQSGLAPVLMSVQDVDAAASASATTAQAGATTRAALETSLAALAPESTERAATQFKYAQFLAAIVREFAAPLKLAPATVRSMIARFEHCAASLRSEATLACLLRVVADVATELQDLSVRVAASRLLEAFVLDLCLPSASASSASSAQPLQYESAMLEALMQLLASHDEHADDQSVAVGAIGDAPIALSSAARLALLRRLLALEDAVSRATVDCALAAVLSDSARVTGYLDTPVAVTYAAIMEEQWAARTSTLAQAAELLLPRVLGSASASASSASLAASSSQSHAPPVEARAKLDWIACVRRLIVLFAEAVSGGARRRAADDASAGKDAGDSPSAAATSGASIDALHAQLAPLLRSDRQIAMFLLKQLERLEGVAAVRERLTTEPFKSSAWMTAWVATGEVRFSFLDKKTSFIVFGTIFQIFTKRKHHIEPPIPSNNRPV